MNISRRKVIKIVVALLVIFAFSVISNFIHKYGLGSTQYKPVIIESDSMEPTIMTGAVIIVQYCSINDVEVGDIIMFYAPQLHKYNTHRVIAIGEDHMYTQGDNTNAPDEGTVIDDALVGKVVHIWNWAAKYTGAFVQNGNYARHTVIIALFAVAAVLSLIWLAVFLFVVARWMFVVTVVLLKGAYTPTFYDKLKKDVEVANRLIQEPVPDSLFWRIRLYDTLRNFHRDMDGYEEFLNKRKR